MQLQAIALVVLVSCVVCYGDDICDICACQKNNNDDVYEVSCDCEKTKDISTTMDNMKDLHHIKTFHASNCDSLTFQKNSFKDARDLTSVTVLNVRSVVYPVGVFAALQSLKIENVQDLRFGKQAFTGAPLTEIYIRHSRIDELPFGAFFDMKDLQKFELNNITVLKVQKESIKLTAKKVLITQSYFDFIAEKGIDITSENLIDINYSTFETFENNLALIAKSIEIIIENNWFPEIPLGLLPDEVDSNRRTSFTNNSIGDFTLQSYDSKLNGVDFRYNLFQTNCSSFDNVISYKLNVDNEMDDLLENNYWYSQCLSGFLVPLSMTELSFNFTGNMSECNEDVVEEFITNICLGPTPSLGMGEPREGRFLDDTTTPTPTTTTMEEARTLVTESQRQHQDMHPVYSDSVSLRKEVGSLGFMLLIAVFVSSW